MERANAVGLGVPSALRGWWRAFALAAVVSLALALSGGTRGGGRGGMSGSGGEAGNNPDLAIPDQVVVLPCTICVRAQNCCKAEGLTDCNYARACANASSAQQTQFYLPLCNAVLSASSTGGKKTADACGF